MEMKRYRGVRDPEDVSSSGRCHGSFVSQPACVEHMFYGSGLSLFLFIKDQDPRAEKEVQRARCRPQQPA